MPPRLAPLLAVLLLALVAGASAEAATAPAEAAAAPPRLLAGTVAGAPEARGARVLVPVLLEAAAARRAGLTTPVVRVSVPVAGGLRGRQGPLAAADLRLGDRVAADRLALPPAPAHVVRPRLRADALRLRDRGTIASFAALDAAVADARAAFATAFARLDAPTTPVRPGLLVLREQLVLLAADLERVAAAVQRLEGRVARRALPAADPGGRHAAERRDLRATLGGARDATRDTATVLGGAASAVDGALAGLDPGAAAVPAAQAPALRAALERAEAALAGLAPPRIGPAPRAV